MKLYSAIYQSHDPFGIFDEVVPCYDETLLDKDGVLLLHGGADISPSIYGEKANKYTYAKNTLSERDSRELKFINKAVTLGIPIVGICRGAQLVCAYSGGKLVQDVTGHEHGDHNITTKEGNILRTNSIHHQMMRPLNTNHEILAWSSPPLSKHYLGDNEELEVTIEPEIVYFKEVKALAIQGHPEYLNPTNRFVGYCTTKIKEYFNVMVV